MSDLQVDQLRIMARLYPDEVAYRHLDARTDLTFAEWHEQSSRLAHVLIDAGITKGDRVAIDLPNDEFLAWITTYVAIHKAGAVAVPVNSRLTSAELGTILNHAEVSATITGGEQAEKLADVWPAVDTLATVLTTDQQPLEEMQPYTGALLAADPDDVQVPVEAGDLADIMYTSGTTGTPKGVAVRHRNVALLPNGEVPFSGDCWIHASPPFTFAGISFVFNPMKMGMTGMYQARFDAANWYRYVEQYAPTAAFLVPAMCQLLIAHDRWADADLTSLTLVAVGSAPLAPDTLVQLCQRMPGAAVTNSYGMTEAGPAYCSMPEGEVLRRMGSVGQPMPPMEVRIVDPVSGEEVPVGEEGEIRIRMEGRQREYYRDPDATAETWTDDGWLTTGDVGRLDEDGFLYIVGRLKEVIIRGGNNIHATDVEAVLVEHPDVLEAAVLGIPHEVLGEDIAAFVVPVANATLDPEEVKAFCAERLTDYKCPRRVHVIHALPRNPTGKVVKRELASRPELAT